LKKIKTVTQEEYRSALTSASFELTSIDAIVDSQFQVVAELFPEWFTVKYQGHKSMSVFDFREA